MTSHPHCRFDYDTFATPLKHCLIIGDIDSIGRGFMKVNLSTKLICIDEYRLLLKNLGEEWLSLRSVEIHRTFFNNENQKHAFIHLPNIVRIGQLCRLASMMRRRESLDYDQARRLALYLDMQPDTFDVNINAMEGLGWVKRDPNMVLEEFIPTLPVVLGTMGRLYRSPDRELPV